MADFLIDRKMQIDLPVRSNILFLQIFCKSQKDRRRQLIIKETALNIAGFRHPCPGLKAYVIACHDPQGFRLLAGIDILINDYLHAVPGSRRRFVVSVDMDGRIGQLAGSLINLSAFRNDPDILRLRVIGLHSADIGKLQMAVGLDLMHHGAQRVAVSLQKDRVLLRLSSKISHHAPFPRLPSPEPEVVQLL